MGRNCPEGELSQTASLMSRCQGERGDDGEELSRRRTEPNNLTDEQVPGCPTGFKLGSLEERVPLTDAKSPSQEVGRRKHGGLYLKVLALNSQEGLEGASQEEIQARNRPGSPHPGVTITGADG